VKKTESKIGRATLLKSGGTAALATLLTGALEGRADACCSPIDLQYTDDPQIAATTRRRKAAATPIKGLWLRSPHAPSPQPDSTWTLAFSIPSAHAAGTDENKGHHGTIGHGTPLSYTISVFIKY
jgi:hypothetical protein